MTTRSLLMLLATGVVVGTGLALLITPTTGLAVRNGVRVGFRRFGEAVVNALPRRSYSDGFPSA